ncbi:hypothetical protein RJ640_028839 [Escallonia rubra]|uniref:Reverse transcriptase Ty1/copia-type domain-containing protein n=1 Tax=Escallonia rubra TaxID=112253 RepID=A0AA88QU47_9ASTE|nr:hypothetical protein RJ640_028839 [Escallonia rubra]
MYGEHPNGGRTEIESRDVDFIENDFPSIGDASKNLDLYELEEVEATLPSPSEGGELVHHPVVAEDSISDLQSSRSILDSGSTPQGPLGQQDSQLRRAGNDMSSIVATKQWLSSIFEMKDMGEANYVLGVKIVRDRSKRLLGLSQETYIKKVIERFRMHNSKPIDTPMDKACTLTTDQCPKNDEEKNRMSKVPYAAAVGTHIDEAVTVHCDNTAALDFVKDPKYHGKAKLIGLRYHFIRALVAQGEVSMKHIPTGIMVADPLTKPIARDVFLSHIRSMGLRRHGFKWQLIRSFHEWTKHIETALHFICQRIQSRVLVHLSISTNHQLAGIFTKALGWDRFHELLGKLGISKLHAPT